MGYHFLHAALSGSAQAEHFLSCAHAAGLKPGDRGDSVTRLQRTLRSYGYGLKESGTYDEPTRATVVAFQRHFRQARVDGIADPSTLLTLRALIETRPAPLAIS
jgi:N-acetylmuramoyl-L-alanine amidase